MIVPQTELTLLVCEASRAQRAMLSSWGKASGFQVIEAQDGHSALAMVRDRGVDVVVTGIEMADMTGLELGWHIKSLPANTQAYVIVVTSATDPRLHIEALDSGADDFLRKPFEEGELRARLRVAGRIARFHHELYRLAQTDPLTGAANRRQFTEVLARRIVSARAEKSADPSTRAKSADGELALILLDLDHFKSVNDRFGHAAGDMALQSVVAAVQAWLGVDALLARMGGEEFAVIQPNVDPAAAFALADRIRRAVAGLSIQTGDVRFGVTISAGVALAPAHAMTADDLMKSADLALYRSKNAGRNRVTLAE